MKVTYYGHSCFAVEAGGKTLLFDPYITENALAKSVNVDQIRADYILLSHGHDDHTGDVERVARRTKATLVGPYEVVMWFQKKGLNKIHPMNHGGAWNFDFGRVKLVNAVHSSSMPDGSYGGHPAGFVVETASGNFYYSGDTALTLDMKLIGESTRLNFAALPIGDNFTMGIEDAVKAAGFLGCDHILGVHYDTFEYIKIDHAAALKKFQASNKNLHLLKPGESHDF